MRTKVEAVLQGEEDADTRYLLQIYDLDYSQVLGVNQ